MIVRHLVIASALASAGAGWNARTPPFTFQAHSASVVGVSYAPDGQSLLTAASNGVARVWNLSGSQLAELDAGQRQIFGAVFDRSPAAARADVARRPRILTAGYDGTARVWDPQGKEMQRLAAHRAPVTRASFSPDGRLIVTSSDDGSAKLWDVAGKALVSVGGRGTVRNVTFHPHGGRLLTTSDDGAVRLWNLEGRRLLEFQTPQGSVRDVSFAPNGRVFATAGFDGTARVWDISGKQLASQKSLNGAWMNGVSVSPDGQRVAAASDDGFLRVFDLGSNLVHEIDLRPRRLLSVGYRPDGKQLAVGGSDGSVVLLDLMNAAP